MFTRIWILAVGMLLCLTVAAQTPKPKPAAGSPDKTQPAQPVKDTANSQTGEGDGKVNDSSQRAQEIAQLKSSIDSLAYQLGTAIFVDAVLAVAFFLALVFFLWKVSKLQNSFDNLARREDIADVTRAVQATLTDATQAVNGARGQIQQALADTKTAVTEARAAIQMTLGDLNQRIADTRTALSHGDDGLAHRISETRTALQQSIASLSRLE